MSNFSKTCKTIYIFYHQLTVLLYFINLLLSNQFWNYSFYYTYVINLNYWETNSLFIFLFFLFFIKIPTRFFFFCVVFLFFNSFLFFSISSHKTLLITLIVGTVVIHPVAFYFFTTLFLIKLYYSYNHFFLVRISLNIANLSLFLSLTLLLGSLWASQSNSWGYFWVNDSVEWVLLLTIVYLIYYFHVWGKLTNYNFFLFNLMIINVLVLIRLNFLPTRHNFISSKLTVYFLLFIYNFFFTIVNSSSLSLKKFFKWNALLVLLCFLINPLLFSKYSFFIFFLFFFYYKLNDKVFSQVFHLFIFTFLFLWVIFFNFFFLNYSKQSNFCNFSLFIYKYNLDCVNSFFKYCGNFSFLEFVNFFFWEDSLFSNITTNLFSIYVFLNNFILVYLLSISLVLLKMVEFRFLYKKKTFI